MHSDRVGVVDFPTLGDLHDAWIERHCRIPDGFKRRRPFVEYDRQFWVTANRGRIREDAVFDPEDPPLNQAFTYRRVEVIDGQKVGKGPWAACVAALMACGPDEFGGWAGRGDVYECEDHGCLCGWYYEYERGEPMGVRHPSPLVQCLATSEDQVANVWRPLTAMIHFGPLGKLLAPRSEFIRVRGGAEDPELDQIQKVTSSATARLGAPISGYVQDEHGIYTGRTGWWRRRTRCVVALQVWVAAECARRTRGTRRRRRARSRRSRRTQRTCSSSTGCRQRICRSWTGGSGASCWSTCTTGSGT